MFVAAVIRLRVPSLVNATTASMDETSRSLSPAIVTPPPFGASRTANAFGPSSSSHSINRSLTSSWYTSHIEQTMRQPRPSLISFSLLEIISATALGTTPSTSASSKAVPIVCVLPDPVWP